MEALMRNVTEEMARAEAAPTLDALAAQARIYSENAAANLLQLGRVLTEARERVPHGEWTDWVRENAGMSYSQAAACMGSYRRFGNRELFSGVERSKLFKMLALPEGTEERFMQDNDVEDMTAREVGEAVKKVRDEVRGEIARERRLRMEAERQADRAASDQEDISDAVAEELRQKDAEIQEAKASSQHFAELARQVGNEKAALERECKRLQEEQDMQQAQYDQLQAEYLNLKSSYKRGDAERAQADALTADVFAASVRDFLGMCARMPYMGATFGAMTQAEKATFDENLKAVEGWAAGARRALSAVVVEGGAIVE